MFSLSLRISSLIWFCIILYPPVSSALSPAEVFDKVKDSVFVVKTYDKRQRVIAIGSAVLLPNGRFGTNCHVVKGGANYQVGREGKFQAAAIFAGDPDKDICLLSAHNLEGKPAQLGKASGLRVGVPVYAIGAPQGLELSISDGIVSQLRGGPPPLIQTTAAISAGSSGGGLFDSEGRLVGLTTLYIQGGQSLNFAVPIEWHESIRPGIKPQSSARSEIEWAKHALALRERGDSKSYKDWCRKWTRSDPSSGLAWYCLGESSMLTGGYAEAIEPFRKSIQALPSNATTWANLGFCYEMLNRFDEAANAYQKALHIDPTYVDGWNYLGGAFHFLGREQQAELAYREATRLDVDHFPAWFNLGNTLIALDKKADAVQAFIQAIRIRPNNIYALERLATAYFMTGQRDAGLKTAEKLRRLDPKMADQLLKYSRE